MRLVALVLTLALSRARWLRNAASRRPLVHRGAADADSTRPQSSRSPVRPGRIDPRRRARTPDRPRGAMTPPPTTVTSTGTGGQSLPWGTAPGERGRPSRRDNSQPVAPGTSARDAGRLARERCAAPAPSERDTVRPWRTSGPKTILFCAVLAFAIALSVLLRGRRAVHWLFAAFATDVALWYASQSLAGFFQRRPLGARDGRPHRASAAVRDPPVPERRPARREEHRRRASRASPRSSACRCWPCSVSPYHDRSFALGAVYSYVFGLLAAALIALARRGQRSPSRAVRDRVRFLVVVGAAATTFSLADFLSYLGVHLPPIGAVLAIVFLFVLAESLTRPRLADIYELAGRLLVSTALAFCLAGIFYVFVTVIGGFDTMYLNAVLAAIVFLVLFEPLQTEVETRIHQFFFRERYDLETSVAELRGRLAHVLEIDEMVTTLMQGLENSRRVTTAALYLRDQDGDGFDLARVDRRRGPPSGSRPLARAPCSIGWRSSRRSRSRSWRARARKATSAVLAAAGRSERCRAPWSSPFAATEEPLVGVLFRRRRPRARRLHARRDLAARDGRRADRRRRRQQPRLLAHEGARSPRRARRDGGRPRARGQEPARRHQGRGAAARGGRGRSGRRSDVARVRRHHPRGGQPPRPRRRQLPRLRAPPRRQPHPARPQRRRAAHGADRLRARSPTADRPAARARRAICRARRSTPRSFARCSST